MLYLPNCTIFFDLGVEFSREVLHFPAGNRYIRYKEEMGRPEIKKDRLRVASGG